MSESTTFIQAAEDGDLNTVQSLVDNVKINSKDRGKTALHKAAANERLDVLSFLVARHDVDVNIADDVRATDCYLQTCLIHPLTLC